MNGWLGSLSWYSIFQLFAGYFSWILPPRSLVPRATTPDCWNFDRFLNHRRDKTAGIFIKICLIPPIERRRLLALLFARTSSRLGGPKSLTLNARWSQSPQRSAFFRSDYARIADTDFPWQIFGNRCSGSLPMSDIRHAGWQISGISCFGLFNRRNRLRLNRFGGRSRYERLLSHRSRQVGFRTFNLIFRSNVPA